MRLLRYLVLSLSAALPASAADFQTVLDRDKFLSLIEGHELHLDTWNIRLQVKPNGQISGDMLGWEVTGNWQWKDGYFCREMDWSGYEIDYNCQLVEARGAEALRFTVDQGAGKSATFQLK